MELRLWQFQTELAISVTAAEQVHARRQHVLLEITDNGVSGYGEVSPQPENLNGDPSFSEVVQELTSTALPALFESYLREGELPSWTRITRFAASRSSSVTAYGLIEMALLDLEMRRMGKVAADFLDASAQPLLQRVGSLIGVPSIPDSNGADRIRLKVGMEMLGTKQLEALSAVSVPVLLDFNCSAVDKKFVLSVVDQIKDVCTVAGVEQPFAPGNLIDHSQLATSLDVPVSIDEGVRSTLDLDKIARYGAAKIVCLKPARLGGIAATRTALRLSRDFGLEPYIGGFFESTLARRVNFLLASSPGVGPSDVEFTSESTAASELFRPDDYGFGLSICRSNDHEMKLITSL